MPIMTEISNGTESRSLAACYRLLIQASQENRQRITLQSQNDDPNEKEVIENREKVDSTC